MTSHLKALLTVTALAALTVSARAEHPAKPYEVNASYVLVFGPLSTTNAVLPTGPVTIIAESGNWVQVQYSTVKNERNKSDGGKVEPVETVRKAWLNLAHVAAFLDPEKAK